MRWERKARSESVEHRRGGSEGGLPGGVSGGSPGQRVGLPNSRGRNGRFSLTSLLLMLLLMMFLGTDPLSLLGGVGEREMDPFCCPADERVYVDVAFYDALRARLGALGDIEDGLRTASAIGNGRIQRMAGRGGHSESFDHGSSAEPKQCLEWGLASGDPDDCDIFGA